MKRSTMFVMLLLSAVALSVGCGTKGESSAPKPVGVVEYAPETVKLRPGEFCPQSGQYRNSKTDKQTTCVKGNVMPPGPAGSTWTLTDATRH